MSAGPNDADPTAVLVAYWNESERRLYPTATTNPDAYKSAVKLVRAVADALAPVADLEDLAEHWESRSDTMDEATKATGEVPAYGLDAEIAGAGFALRRRELLAEQAEHRRLASIAAARRAGRDWAVVHEQGRLGSGLVDPYQCIELHLPTGLAMVSMVEPDPSTMSPVYVVTVIEMGDEQGSVPEIDAGAFDDLETDDPQQFEEHRRQMRGRVEAAAA